MAGSHWASLVNAHLCVDLSSGSFKGLGLPGAAQVRIRLYVVESLIPISQGPPSTAAYCQGPLKFVFPSSPGQCSPDFL